MAPRPRTNSSSVGQLSLADQYKIMDLYFDPPHARLYGYQLDSFNAGFRSILKSLTNDQFVFWEKYTRTHRLRNKIKISNVTVESQMDDDDEPMDPHAARLKGATYAVTLRGDIQQLLEIEDYVGAEGAGDREIKVIAEEKNTTIARLPIMVRSEYCATQLQKDKPSRECRFDPGSYFIVRGSEKVVIGLERICENRYMCFTKKDANYEDGTMYVCQVNSKNVNYPTDDTMNDSIHILSVKMKKDNSVVVNMNQLAEIPVFVFFRALGVETDRDIIRNIVYDEEDSNMINLLKISQTRGDAELAEIRTKDDAQQFLMGRLKHRYYADASPELRARQKAEHLEHLMIKEFLPHMGVTAEALPAKTLLLGKMVNRLLNCFLKRTPPDDRDSFGNKRVDLPGALYVQLFKQYFRKMLNDTSRAFKKKNNDDLNPVSVINLMRFSTIEQGLNSALLTGTWGSSKRKGVAMQLQRLTYKQTVSNYRRIMPPPLDASNSKVENMRHVDPRQYGFIDAVESPDGKNIGIHKHLSLSATVTTAMEIEQIVILKRLVEGLKDDSGKRLVVHPLDVPVCELHLGVHLTLNGEWFGVTRRSMEVYEALRARRKAGLIGRLVSVNYSRSRRAIDIYTDGGRILRPLLCVKDNRILLSPEMLVDVDDRRVNPKRVTSWEAFLDKYPDTVEYVDIADAENLMVAMYPADVGEARERMERPIKNPHKSGNALNRYDDSVYVRYTHAEIHPCLQLGNISCTIPFCERNQAPRNYYSYQQSRQAMGIYATNYRNRFDQSYILYHSMRPLTTTRPMLYTHDLEIPAGEMMVVAIACYTGLAC